jgi:hypothetical protein
VAAAAAGATLMSWVSSALPVIGGGLVGSTLTYLLTWFRERRRTLDSYRAPQRAAIAEIVAATNELGLMERHFKSNNRALVSALEALASASAGATETSEHAAALRRVSQVREKVDTSINDVGQAIWNVKRAFEVGRLTVIDAECYEAMVVSFGGLTGMKADLASDRWAVPADDPAALNRFVDQFGRYVDHLQDNITNLVDTSYNRLSPKESCWNKRKRAQAREALKSRTFALPELVADETSSTDG